MSKYSIIIPVYNNAKTIERCLDSIFSQNFTDYEVIVVNDGSQDESMDLVKKYKGNLIIIDKKNGGVSDARNDGIKKVKGEYFTFVDADDFIKEDLLEKMEEQRSEKETVDLICFGITQVDENKKEINRFDRPEIKQTTGENLFKEFVEKKVILDTPVGYMYKTTFFKENNFSYAKGHQHEDFGLTPFIIIKAKSAISLSYHGYYYVQTNSSITRGLTWEQKKQNAYDMLYHFDRLKKMVDEDESIGNHAKKYFYNYIAYGVLLKVSSLNQTDQRQYIEELKQRKVTSLLLSNNPKRFLKKIYIKTNLKKTLNSKKKRKDYDKS